MSYFTLIGSRCYVSTVDPKTLTSKTVSDITNALPAVVTATAHGYSDAAEVLLAVGWEDFNDSVFRIDNTDTNTFELPGYDSSNTDFYPQGSDTGTAHSGITWQEIGQILGITDEGGNARSITLNPYDKRNGVRIYTGFEPAGAIFELGFDPTRTDQQVLAAAARVLGKRAVKFVLAGPSYFYGYGTVSMSPLPQFGDVLRRRATFSFEGLFTGFTG